MVGVFMREEGEVEFLTQFRTCEVVATSSIDDNFDGLPIDAGTSLEDVRALVFIFIGLGSQDPCDHKRGLASCSHTRSSWSSSKCCLAMASLTLASNSSSLKYSSSPLSWMNKTFLFPHALDLCPLPPHL